MRKTLGKRLISGVTSALMAVSLTLPNGLIGSVGEQFSAKAAGPVATLAGEDLNVGGPMKVNPAELFVRLKFRTTEPSGYGSDNKINVTMSDDDNEYYIIAHAKTADTYSTGYGPPANFPYADDNRDFYGIYEVVIDNDSEFKKKLDFLPTTSVNMGWYSQDVAPDIESLDFTVVKNKGTDELTVSEIGDTTKYDEVETINGMTLSSDNKVTSVFRSDYSGIDYCVEIKAEGGHKVIVEYFDFDGTTPKKVETEESVNYYVLSKLKKDGEVVAYSSNEINPEENAESTVHLWEFNEVDETGVETGNKITYDPTVYTLDTDDEKIRVYHSLSKEIKLETYKDFSDISKASSDVIAPYIYIDNSTEGNVTTITAKKEHVTYDLKLVFDDATTIRRPENYYLLLDAEHQSGSHTYYWMPLEVNGEKEVVIPIQTQEETQWQHDNGRKSNFTGGEKSVTAKIYKGERGGQGDMEKVIKKRLHDEIQAEIAKIM